MSQYNDIFFDEYDSDVEFDLDDEDSDVDDDYDDFDEE